MCGIVGISSEEIFSSHDIIESLKRLEYRGYDSFGFADNNGNMEKFVGEIDNNRINNIKTNTAISHTRWSTHGCANKINAHPHTDCKKEIYIAHNGILDNYNEMKKELEEKGHIFTSDTDSEVIAHFFEDKLKEKDMKGSVSDFFSIVKGEFAILMLRKNDSNIYAFKRGSPLVLGISGNKTIIASDIYAFSHLTNKAIFFNEDEFAIINKNSREFFRYDSALKPITKTIQTFEWKEEKENNNFDHHMLKEIYEQPLSSGRLINSLQTEQKDRVNELKKMISSSKRVVFIASGTSYHASLLGVYFLSRAGIETHTLIASEFRNFSLFDKNTLVIAISQSGETMDVIEALRGIKQKGVKIASLVNVPYSTVERMSNISINICAGQEICVAATKTFTNQVIMLLHLTGIDTSKISNSMKKIFEQEEKIKDIAKKLKNSRDMYILGRGFTYPVAREIALKLKEISYIHAEGMMAGELKHGTLALIEDGTPVISLMPKGDEHIISNTKEVESRGAHIITFSNNGFCKDNIKIDASEHEFSLLCGIAGQLLTYYIALEKQLPIDKPRNLAKCVTVK